MATLADISSPMDDRGQYLQYVEACQESGKKALPYAQWVQAGRPRG